MLHLQVSDRQLTRQHRSVVVTKWAPGHVSFMIHQCRRLYVAEGLLCWWVMLLRMLQDPTSHLQQLLKSMPDGAAPKATFVKGDRVVVTGGDLATLEGRYTGS